VGGVPSPAERFCGVRAPRAHNLHPHERSHVSRFSSRFISADSPAAGFLPAKRIACTRAEWGRRWISRRKRPERTRRSCSPRHVLRLGDQVGGAAALADLLSEFAVAAPAAVAGGDQVANPLRP